MDLDNSDPVIWRALDLRSDLTLDLVHEAIQTAFDWWDYHLNRFALGGGPRDRDSQVFACMEDIEEADEHGGEFQDSAVRPEEVLPFEQGSASVVCVAGERAAPPEDCGHLLTEAGLAEVVDDPAAALTPDATVVTIPRARTLGPLEQPALLAEHLTRF